MFEKQKDLDIYNKFLPKVRRFMFQHLIFQKIKEKNLRN